VKRAALLLLFAAAPVFAALPDDELRRGLLNLVHMEELSYRMQYYRAVRGSLQGYVAEHLIDPWGTPYRVEIAGDKFKVIGAGSDRKFEPATWSESGQFGDLAIDVVDDDGKTIRSNYTWLNRMVPDRLEQQAAVGQAIIANPGKPLAAILTTPKLVAGYLLMVEQNTMMLRDPMTLDVLRAETTQLTMATLATATDRASLKLNDEWGTPLRVENGADGSSRIISAGADRKFDPQSWTAPMKADLNDDQVYASGKGFVRRFDRNAFAERILAEAAANEPSTPGPRTVDRGGVKAYLVGGDVKAPVITKKIEVPYPPEMRTQKKLGLVIAEVIIDEEGKLRDVKILLSPDPAFDRVVKETLAKWVFLPGKWNGRPVPVLYNLTIHFTLDE